MLIDTHAHLNFNAFKNDVDKVIGRALDNNIWIINVGSQYSTSERAVQIAEKYPEGVYAAVGLHPIHLETGLVKIKVDQEEIEFQSREEEFSFEKYKNLVLSSSKVVAIGEIGFDWYIRPKTKKKLEEFKKYQRRVLDQQLDLAKELNLPIIFHCRLGHNELIETLNFKLKTENAKLRGVIHCFTGTLEQAEEYIKLGFYLGFNGLIFKKIKELPNSEEVIKKIPLEKILLETDCPYLMPPINVNQCRYQYKESAGDQTASLARNEPIYVRYVAERIAKIKNTNYQEIETVTTENAKKLFKISIR